MTWHQFCRKLVEHPLDQTTTTKQVEAGIDKGLPTLRVTLGQQSKSHDHSDAFEASAHWDQSDVCRALALEGKSLLIDDFENAPQDLVKKVSDMCKLMTQSYASEKAKLIVIGSDDVYRRLYSAKPSLGDRLIQLSLGTLSDKNRSWKFLTDGLEALGISTPINDQFVPESERLDICRQCVESMYRAADGLPKSLNGFGRKIAFAATGRRRINLKDFARMSKQIIDEDLDRYGMDCPVILEAVGDSKTAQGVLLYLYKEGIGQIHHWNKISADLGKEFPLREIEQALSKLVKVGFLIQTGVTGEILFVRRPEVAHTLGTVLHSPEAFQLPSVLEGLVKPYRQLSFSFV